MPIDQHAPVALCLFAHQDDEFGVYPLLDAYRRQGVRVRCAYLTDGSVGTVSSATRNAESLAVLGQLGVDPADVAFAGAQLGIPDAGVPHHLAPAADWIAQWLVSAGTPMAIHVMAWEGGHHDHDAIHALTVTLAHDMGLLDRVTQFALYNGARIPAPLFRILSPLRENGLATRSNVGWAMRARCIRYCLSYPSQRTTWIGLFPFALLHYVLRGVQELQGVSMARIEERPHAGRLYYESRKFFTWDKMQAALAAWRAGR